MLVYTIDNIDREELKTIALVAKLIELRSTWLSRWLQGIVYRAEQARSGIETDPERLRIDLVDLTQLSDADLADVLSGILLWQHTGNEKSPLLRDVVLIVIRESTRRLRYAARCVAAAREYQEKSAGAEIVPEDEPGTDDMA